MTHQHSLSSRVVVGIGLLSILTLSASAEGPAEPKQNANTKQAVQWVEQLGDRDFSVRENASERLVELGVPAVAAIEAGCNNQDPEIRFRCKRILSVIRYNERWSIVEAFEADTDGKKGITLPGWKFFTELIGNDKTARSLFVEMQRAEPDLLTAIQEDPKKAGALFAQRCVQMQQAFRLPGAHIEGGNIAALLFVGAHSAVEVSQQSSMSLYSLCNHTSFQQLMQNGNTKQHIRKLLGAVVAQGGTGNAAYYRLMLALRYDLKEGLVPARKMLSGGAIPQHFKQYAILTTAKLGGKEDIPVLQKQLKDQTTCSTTTINGKRCQVQVRDVALVGVIHLSKQDPKKFGFPRLSNHDRYLFNPGTMGFSDTKERDEAFAKWAAFEAEQKKKP